MNILRNSLLAAALSAAALGAQADINVGVTLSATGPAASLGIPEKNSIELMPARIGNQKVNYIVLDDASDTTAAVTNARKLIAEHKVDVLIGSTTTPLPVAPHSTDRAGASPPCATARPGRAAVSAQPCASMQAMPASRRR